MNWVIAVDQSAEKSHDTDAAMGVAVFCDGELISHGELTPDPETGFTRVRNHIRNKIKSIYANDPCPDIWIATESVYFGFNPAVAAGLIRVQSHIEAVALDAGCHYSVVTPQESFRSITGLTQYPLNDKGTRKGTRKDAVIKAAIEKYDLPEDISSHECDAIAIAESVIQRNEKSAV